MKRTELEALGMTKEQIDAVMKINGDDIENAKAVNAAEITNLKAENDTLSKQVKDRDKQIDTLKASAGDNEELKKQIETLQADNKAKDEAHAKEMNQVRIDVEVDARLSEVGSKNNRAVMALIDKSKIGLDESGKLTGFDEQIAEVQKSSSFLFKGQEQPPSLVGFQSGVELSSVNVDMRAGYVARLEKAQQSGNTLEVIKVKQEAYSAAGLIL